jgi:hypothetical protein
MKKIIILGCLTAWLCLTAEQCPTFGNPGDNWNGVYSGITPTIPCDSNIDPNCESPMPTQEPNTSPSM